MTVTGVGSDGDGGARDASWLPNALTLGRLALVPFVVLFLSGWGLVDGRWAVWVAAALYCVAVVTDALDGWLARRLDAVSRFGRLIDPLADKLLVLSTLVMLCGPRYVGEEGQITGVAPWMVAVVFARELVVTTFRGLAEGEGKDFSANIVGKAKMLAQSVGIGTILWVVALAPADASWAVAVNLALAWIVTVVSAISAVPYVIAGASLLGDRGDRLPKEARGSGINEAIDEPGTRVEPLEAERVG